MAPSDASAIRRYWSGEQLPFTGLPDPDHVVAKLYRQEVNLLKMGRMPALLLVDKTGQIRYTHYGHSMSDIPDNRRILDLLDALNAEGG